jgi:predicted Zn-ribbon and HTH transcriptional regulator
MQNPITITHPAQPLPTDELTPSKKLQHAGSLVERAARATADEWNNHLTWGDRDRITRQLREAVRLIREAAQSPVAPIASCLECGAEERADQLARDQCPTCEFLNAVSH